MSDFQLIINGEHIPMNDFVGNVIHDVLLAILSHLRNVDISEITKIEVS